MTENRKRIAVSVRKQADTKSVAVSLATLGASVNIEALPVRATDITPAYTGDYTVDPLFTEQTLETANKRMTRDVTVHAIYTAETSNPAGGVTYYIGGEFL